MDMPTFPILVARQVTQQEFVEFWSGLYPEKKYSEAIYQENIGRELTEDRILALFKWKNGMQPSEKKANSIKRFLSPSERIDSDADEETLTKLLNRRGGAIWRIFWLHLQHHQKFPIYDQHAHRAMAYLLKWDKLKIPDEDAQKITVYLKDYLPFFDSFDDCDRRKVDRALWTFGRFLTTIPKDWRGLSERG